MSEHGLGRRVALDARDRAYPMTALLPERSLRTYRYWWANGLWADQGATGACVGHAWAHWLEDGPVTHPDPLADPFDIYCGATTRDPWPENDGCDLQFGTSVRGGAEFLIDSGRISEYRWAWDVDTVTLALLEEGPVVVGSHWYSQMFYPGIHGLLDIAGEIVGGHAYVLNGVNLERGVVRLKNSWGRDWGNNGSAWLKLVDLHRLLDEDGEACIAVERA